MDPYPHLSTETQHRYQYIRDHIGRLVGDQRITRLATARKKAGDIMPLIQRLRRQHRDYYHSPACRGTETRHAVSWDARRQETHWLLKSLQSPLAQGVFREYRKVFPVADIKCALTHCYSTSEGTYDPHRFPTTVLAHLTNRNSAGRMSCPQFYGW